MSEDSDDKTFEASQKRLDDQRREGRIARSQDLLSAAAYTGFLLALVLTGGWSAQHLAAQLGGVLANADLLSRQMTAGARASLVGILPDLLLPLLPVFGLPAMMVLLALTAQRAFLFTPTNLLPKLSRISPLATATQKFGRRGMFDFAKNTVKLAIVAGILGAFLTGRMDEVVSSLRVTPEQGLLVLDDLLTGFVTLVVLTALVIGMLDYLWQIAEHRRQNRMSRQEMKDEHKEVEGDPHAKWQRRQRGQEIATNRMLRDVAEASVVIVNPTHYAVALKWSKASGRAPVCVAKGVDEIAARIRERAAEAGVPMHSDPPTARALHSVMQIGDEIPADQFRAVAAAIRFADAMRKRVRGR
ncbi:flagellar biosynthesis protein FlhB [Gemmobacter lutimaris]|uniref:Flagellar biosynthesis protein FlhB n=1 Tax=Gemmobacter lutimaris TaxID=2306023 RepID=A0A398BKQ9_9RHOB|nr:flagellar type III secretion system protein FlhB [Gemmobacter lutimaris]RID91002.1 flagellar biosynthesis protein FlhB [Gemmobacter lutimaris]